MNPVIELNGLSVTFGGRAILKDLSGSVKGRAVGLLGPNGAGKTTLIHTLLGFHAPSSGTVRILGEDIATSAKSLRAAVGYMPERDSFIAKMSCVRFVRLMAELSGIPSDAALERAHEALFYVGLGEARYRSVDTYSLGMKQLAKLAQAIVHGPRLLILDEPTNGLEGERRIKLVMQDGVEIEDLYRLAFERRIQIRRLNYKRDSLEDIFLKAMESEESATAGGR